MKKQNLLIRIYNTAIGVLGSVTALLFFVWLIKILLKAIW